MPLSTITHKTYKTLCEMRCILIRTGALEGSTFIMWKSTTMERETEEEFDACLLPPDPFFVVRNTEQDTLHCGVGVE